MPRKLTAQTIDWTVMSESPSHWGAAMTVASVTSVLRNVESGIRDTWCDLLSELLEGDPHAHSVLKKCYSGIANQDYELLPAKAESARDKKNAQIIADDVAKAIENIPNWAGCVFKLLWGHFTGASAQEIMWSFDGTWSIDSLRNIPSRRIHFDDDFEPYFGEVYSATGGVRFSDYPGKFITYLPVVTGDIQTREGLARVIIFWLAFKRWSTRELLSYMERYGKPTPVVTYKTDRTKADEDDLVLANAIIENIGRGTQPGAYVPDTLTIAFADAAASAGGSGKGADRTVHQAFINLCNAEISKAVLGNTLTTEVGSSGGNRSLGERQGEDQQDIQQAIAKQIDGLITEALVRWYVRLNYGDVAAEKYCPRYHTKIEQPDDLESASKVLETLVNAGLRIASADVYEKFGYRMPTMGEDVLVGSTAPTNATPEPADNQGSDDESEDDDNNTGPEEEPMDEDEAQETGTEE